MSNLYCHLGRIGDVLSIAPLLWSDYQKTGKRSRLMIAAEYENLLDGFSYIDPVIYNGPHYELDKAMTLAKTMVGTDDKLICTQLNGPVEEVSRHTYEPAGQSGALATSFQKESWKVAGRLNEWDDCLPLVINQRDKKRERCILECYGLLKRGPRKPIILLALEGNSSPFKNAELLRSLVTAKFSETHRIIEIPKCERIYDLLALYEKAELLIAIDSAPLHLAWAIPSLPVFALANDTPTYWNGASWRPNHLWYCRYGDWTDRAVEMIEAIENNSHNSHNSHPDCVTVFSAYGNSDACISSPCSLPVKRGMCGRDSYHSLLRDDGKRSPFLRDVIRMSMQRAGKDGTAINLSRPQISYTNFDHPSPSYAYRIENGNYRPIVDLFTAPKSFWREIMPEIPDLLLNGDYKWSEVLMIIFKERGSTDVTGVCEFVKEAK